MFSKSGINVSKDHFFELVITFVSFFSRKVSNKNTFESSQIYFTSIIGMNMHKNNIIKYFERKIRNKARDRKLIFEFIERCFK